MVALINVESLTKALEGENPCGENLRWDKGYLELERLAEGKEETQFSKGEEPEWREVRDKAVELLARGRHMRLAVILMLAAVRLEGYPGLRDGLKVIQTWLEQHWDQVWPVLDAEDNNDPTERVNALAAISTPMATFGDKVRLLDRIYECPICESRQLGNFSLRDMAIASGTLTENALPEGQAPAPDDKPKPTLAMIDGAFAETEKERLAEIAKAAEEASASLTVISGIFDEKCGAGIGPDVSHLQTILKDAVTQIRRRLDGGEASTDDGSQTDTGSGEGDGGGGGGRRKSLSGEVSSAADASLALEKVIKYYEANEPSSPVPMIVRCAQVMVGKGFRDIVRVLNPEAVNTLDNIAQAGSGESSS